MKKAIIMEGVLKADSREELEHKFTMLALDLMKQMPEAGIVRLACGTIVRGMMQESGKTQGRDAIELMQTVGIYMNDAGRERMKPHNRRRNRRK